MVEKRNPWEGFHALRGLSREERRRVRFIRDTGWIDENFPELRREYPDQYIAVRRRRVVGVNPDPEALLKGLAETYPEHLTIPIEFIPAEGFHIVSSNF